MDRQSYNPHPRSKDVFWAFMPASGQNSQQQLTPMQMPMSMQQPVQMSSMPLQTQQLCGPRTMYPAQAVMGGMMSGHPYSMGTIQQLGTPMYNIGGNPYGMVINTPMQGHTLAMQQNEAVLLQHNAAHMKAIAQQNGRM